MIPTLSVSVLTCYCFIALLSLLFALSRPPNMSSALDLLVQASERDWAKTSPSLPSGTQLGHSGYPPRPSKALYGQRESSIQTYATDSSRENSRESSPLTPLDSPESSQTSSGSSSDSSYGEDYLDWSKASADDAEFQSSSEDDDDDDEYRPVTRKPTKKSMKSLKSKRTTHKVDRTNTKQKVELSRKSSKKRKGKKKKVRHSECSKLFD